MIKRIIGWATLCSCFFLFQTVDAQTEELLTPAIEQPEVITEEPQLPVEEPQVALSIEELSNAVSVAEKKLESIQKELRYTETLKGNKKYKKEIALKFESVNNDLKLAKAAYEAATAPEETEVLEDVKLIDEASTETSPQ